MDRWSYRSDKKVNQMSFQGNRNLFQKWILTWTQWPQLVVQGLVVVVAKLVLARPLAEGGRGGREDEQGR